MYGLPRGHSTVDLGVGFPYLLNARVNVGAGNIADNFGFDAGVGVRTLLTRSEIGLGGRLMLVNSDPFTAGAFSDLWWGSSLIDSTDRNGFTFDGIHATNGFQPLWLLLLVAVFKFVPGDVWPLRVVALVEAALIAAAAAGIFRVLRGRIGTGPALAAGISIVALPGSPSVFRAGMESGLLLWLFVIIWRRWLALAEPEAEVPSRRRCLSLGLLCGLAFLTRIEAIVLVLAVVILAARRWLSTA